MGLDISYYKLVKEIPRTNDDLHYENGEIWYNIRNLRKS